MTNGKGDTPRPFSVSPTTYAANYARIRWTDDPPGYDDRAKVCPPLTDSVDALRQEHLEQAREVVLGSPPMHPHVRARLNALWAAWDAAHPHELAPEDSRGDQ